MFWGAEVQPGKPLRFTSRGDMKITHVTLGAQPGTKDKIGVYVTTDETKALVCYLQEQKVEQKSTDIYFPSGAQVTFEVDGGGPKASVYVLGTEVPDAFFAHAHRDEEDADEDDDEEEDDDDEDETDEGKQRIIREGIRSVSDAQKELQRKKQKLEVPAAKPPAPKTPSAKPEAKAVAAKPAAAKPAAPSPAVPATPGKWTTTKQGLKFMDLEIGKGAPAKIRDRVAVQYRGALSNGKVFDSGTFRFVLGAGEVIRGWDIGVAGMTVGGKRKLIIPSELGYGRPGAPPAIPPNAELHFDVALKGINPPTKKEKKSGRKRQGSPPRA